MQQAWSFATGSGNAAGNLIEYRGVIYANSANGTVFAIDAATGKQRWVFAAGAGIAAAGNAPAGNDGLIFIVCTSPSGSRGICALQAGTGALQWRYSPPSTTYVEPPVMYHGLLMFQICGTACTYTALQQKTGQVVWVYDEPTTCPPDPVSNGVPAAAGFGRLYAESSDGFSPCSGFYTIVLNAQTGQQLSYYIGSAAAIFDGLSLNRKVMVLTEFYGPGPLEEWGDINPRNGAQKWGSDISDPVEQVAMPALAYFKVFLPLAIDLISFKAGRRAFVEFSETPGRFVGASIGNGVLYTSLNGLPSAVFAADPNQSLWQAGGAQNVGFPIVANATVFGACNTTNVCAWTLPSRLRLR